MPNIRILFRNLADVATITASPALVATLPEANLKTQERNKSARTTSLAAQTISYVWPSVQTINMIAARRHNHTAAAQWATPTYSDAIFTTAIDANAAANMFAYTGLDANDVLSEADFRMMKNSARYLTSRSTVLSMKMVLTDAANKEGYFDHSRHFIGQYLELAYQLPYGGAPMTLDNATVQRRMDDGSLVSDKRYSMRKFALNQDWVSPVDWAALLAGIRYAGADRDIWLSVLPESGDYQEMYFQGAVKFVGMSAFDLNRPLLAGVRMNFEET